MVFLDKRAQVIADNLRKLSVKQCAPISGWIWRDGLFLTPEDAFEGKRADTETSEDIAARERPDWRGEFVPFDQAKDHWYGPDRHYWFHTETSVPESFDRKPLWMHIATQINEPDDAKNPQFLVFINGVPVQGADMNHRDVLLSREAGAGEHISIDLQAYTGILHPEFSLMVDFREIDAEIEGLYLDIQVPLDAFPRLEEDSSARREITRVLNDAVNLLDLRDPYSDEFYRTVREARAYLDKALYTDLAGSDEVIASCIGHTHIDVAWWWTVNQTREKAARSFATVLKLMEEYPDYRFMSSQPVLYSFIKERYPEMYGRIRERVREGRWEPEGGMWLESDTNLTSGESLIRQFMHGKRFFLEEFGKESVVLWLPDVFGYSGALPQIMKECGIRYFMTTKISWNQFDKLPYDTFLWRGIDGSEILTHMITTQDPRPTERFITTYNGRLHSASLISAWNRYQQKDINNDVLVAFGHGDGGGGPTRKMLETGARLKKGVKGIPAARQRFAGDYFRDLEERVSGNRRLPVWEGELYFEYHRGTLTSIARNKRGNRKAELSMMDLELFGVMAEPAVSYPAEEDDRLWKGILLNQFHDILPGTAIREVYEVTAREYAQMACERAEIIKKRISALTEEDEGYITVFNTTGFERSGVVELAGPVTDPATGKTEPVAGADGITALLDEDGRRFEVQRGPGQPVVYLEGIPAKGYRRYRVLREDSAPAGGKSFDISPDGLGIRTPFFDVRFDDSGAITGIYDIENGREVLKEGGKGNLFMMYEDKPIYYDDWDIDIYYTEKSWPVTGLRERTWTEAGPVRAVLRQVFGISHSTIVQEIRFYAGERRIDFVTEVDWKEHQHLLKVHFPLAVHTDEATFDIQFGNLTRKVHTNTSWDMARFESGAHKWIDLSEGRYGVSILNDCKYGHSVKDANVGLTLIKSGIEPNPMCDYEMHYFTYSLYPHAGGWRDGGTVREGYFLNQRPVVAPGKAALPEFSLVSSDSPNVVIETVKKAEDGNGVIVRLYECENALTKAGLSWHCPVKEAWECSALEDKRSQLQVNSGRIEVPMRPYEIKTVRIIV